MNNQLLLTEGSSEETVSDIQFTDRRISVKIGRTIKDSADKYEFTKFDLSVEATIPDGVDRQKASDVLFRDIMQESLARETVIRAARGNSEALDKIVKILQDIMKSQEN